MPRLLKQIRNCHGMSVLELLIAVVMSGIVIGAALQFYIAEHDAWMSQNDVSETQQNLRVCLDEVANEMRMGGYALGTHPAFAIGTDSLTVYYDDDDNGSIDTILYYVGPLVSGQTALLRQRGNDQPEIYADCIEHLVAEEISPMLVELELVGYGLKNETDLVGADGHRRRSATTSVLLRNKAI